jgi:hypothetical protein
MAMLVSLRRAKIKEPARLTFTGAKPKRAAMPNVRSIKTD